MVVKKVLSGGEDELSRLVLGAEYIGEGVKRSSTVFPDNLGNS